MYTMVKNIDYPQDPETHEIMAAAHPDLQVQKDDDRKHWSDRRVNTSFLSLPSGRTEISASFIPETPCSCLSPEKRYATKGTKRSIRSS